MPGVEHGRIVDWTCVRGGVVRSRRRHHADRRDPRAGMGRAVRAMGIHESPTTSHTSTGGRGTTASRTFLAVARRATCRGATRPTRRATTRSARSATARTRCSTPCSPTRGSPPTRARWPCSTGSTQRGMPSAIVSSSKNARTVLRAAGIERPLRRRRRRHHRRRRAPRRASPTRRCSSMPPSGSTSTRRGQSWSRTRSPASPPGSAGDFGARPRCRPRGQPAGARARPAPTSSSTISGRRLREVASRPTIDDRPRALPDRPMAVGRDPARRRRRRADRHAVRGRQRLSRAARRLGPDPQSAGTYVNGFHETFPIELRRDTRTRSPAPDRRCSTPPTPSRSSSPSAARCCGCAGASRPDRASRATSADDRLPRPACCGREFIWAPPRGGHASRSCRSGSSASSTGTWPSSGCRSPLLDGQRSGRRSRSQLVNRQDVGDRRPGGREHRPAPRAHVRPSSARAGAAGTTTIRPRCGRRRPCSAFAQPTSGMRIAAARPPRRSTAVAGATIDTELAPDTRDHHDLGRPGAEGDTITVTKYVAYHAAGQIADRSPTQPRRRARRRDAASTLDERRRGGWDAGSQPSSGVARPVLAAHRHRRRGRRGCPAGDPLEPVPDGPGVGPGRRARHRRQGGDRRRLRRPLLLGHRGLRDPDARVQQPDGGARPAAVPLPHAAGRSPPGGRDVAARGAVPMAHDQRRGGVGLLPGGHGAVPHRRRRGVRHRPLRHGHRRHRVPAQRGRRDRWSRSRACSPTSASTTAPTRRASTSTASPAPTSTRRSSTTTCTRT